MDLDAIKCAQQALRELKRRRGSAAAIARGLGIYPQAVSLWRQVPHLRVIQVEKLTGVPREKLRPDLYPARESRG